MKAIQHQGKTLKYLAIEPDGYDPGRSYPMVVLLHGFGAHMGDLAGLSPAIEAEGYVYICPNAPLPVQVGFGSLGYAWTPRGEHRSADDLQRAEEMLSTLFEEVMAQYQVEPGNAVLGGFSQGGMMTYRCGLTSPGLFRGLVALSARIPDTDSLKARLPDDRSQPIFISHGTADPLISIEDGRSSRIFLEAEGYKPDYNEYNMAHEITQEVLDDLVAWIHRVLPV